MVVAGLWIVGGVVNTVVGIASAQSSASSTGSAVLPCAVLLRVSASLLPTYSPPPRAYYYPPPLPGD